MPKQHPEDDAGLIEKHVEEQSQLQTIEIPPVQEEVTPEPVKVELAPENKQAEIQEIERQQQRFAELSQWVAQVKAEEISILKKLPVTKPVQQQEGTTLQPRRKVNIIAMTKGFIENLTHEGNDWLKRDGDDSKRPSLEEMKFFSYEQRINWQLQSSWKLSFERNLGNQPMEGKVFVAFTIDEKGQASEIILVQSSGIKNLDKIVLQNIKTASPFPPLPKHFNMKNYKVTRIIHVTSQRFSF